MWPKWQLSLMQNVHFEVHISAPGELRMKKEPIRAANNVSVKIMAGIGRQIWHTVTGQYYTISWERIMWNTRITAHYTRVLFPILHTVRKECKFGIKITSPLMQSSPTRLQPLLVTSDLNRPASPNKLGSRLVSCVWFKFHPRSNYPRGSGQSERGAFSTLSFFCVRQRVNASVHCA